MKPSACQQKEGEKKNKVKNSSLSIIVELSFVAFGKRWWLLNWNLKISKILGNNFSSNGNINGGTLALGTRNYIDGVS